MNKQYNLRFLLVSLMMPCAILMYFYSRNSTEVSYIYAGALTAVTLGIYAIIFLISRLIFKSALSAFGVCAVVTVFLFGWNQLRSWFAFVGEGGRNTLILALMAAFMLAGGLLLKKIHSSCDKFSLFVLIFAGAFFAMNAFSSANAAIVQAKAQNNFDSENLKTEFLIDSSAASPNIYWFHCDGMLGFDAVEEFFGSGQAQFKAALAERGFAVNEGAEFESAHSTAISIAVQMSPFYYDNSLGLKLETHELATEYRDTSPDLSEARLYNEFINAFTQKGYETFIVSKGGYYAANSDYYYDYYSQPVKLTDINYFKTGTNVFQGLTEMERLREFCFAVMYPAGYALEKTVGSLADYANSLVPGSSELLSADLSDATRNQFLMTPDTGSLEVNFTACMLDVLHRASDTPQLAVFHTLLPHAPFRYDENGNLTEQNDAVVLENYYGHHTYSSKVLIQYIDEILAHDPDAVIVLQADHGLHLNTSAQISEFTGADGNDVALWNSTLSAVRIPKNYQAIDEDKIMDSPLNIVRYLVNSYVGKNYDYLQ